METRRAAVEPDAVALSIGRQCTLLGLSRMDETFAKRPYFGSRRLRDDLVAHGHAMGRDHVRRLMRRVGLEAIYPKQRLSRPNKAHPGYPSLLRDVAVVRPAQVWCSDITYIRLRRGFAYLAAVIDWFSRYVLAWERSLALESGFCVSAVQAAFEVARPEILNTDQGCQYTSEQFTTVVQGAQVRISMDGKGRAFDNIMIERLWRTVKYEEGFLKDYGHVGEARASLGQYFGFYNEERRRSSLRGRTPSAVYWEGRGSAAKGG